MRLSDRTTGFFLVGLGALSAYGGSLLPPVPGQQVGPNVFPIVIGIGLIVCGLMIAFGIGHTFEEEAEADLGQIEGSAAVTAQRSGWMGDLKVLIPPALLFFYVLAADKLGFFLAAAIMVLITAFALGARVKLALPLALLAPVGVHLVFAKLLRVPLPDGLLPLPW
jgi:putative tricarboxylic transport membrane protein